MSRTEFNEEQFLSIYPKGIERHYWTLARNTIIKQVIGTHGLKNKKILEIGCGRGIVVEFLRKSGIDCIGVELSPVHIEHALESFVKTGTDFRSLEKSVIDEIEVVMLFDVIEHIEHDKEFIESIKNTFPKLTHIVVTVPARKEVWSNYDEYNGHFRRYDRMMIRKLFYDLSMKEIENGYFFHALYIPARILLSIAKKRETTIHAPYGLTVFVHALLARFFVLEYNMLPKRLYGTSLIYVAHV